MHNLVEMNPLRAVTIANAYIKKLTSLNPHVMWTVADLPYPKETVKKAIIQTLRTVLRMPPAVMPATKLMRRNFIEGYVHLAYFLSHKEARIFAEVEGLDRALARKVSGQRPANPKETHLLRKYAKPANSMLKRIAAKITRDVPSTTMLHPRVICRMKHPLPLEKGGGEGFAVDEIPLSPPFSKGEGNPLPRIILAAMMLKRMEEEERRLAVQIAPFNEGKIISKV